MTDSVVSIIMPVYNAENHVKEAIESVINQKHKNWELLIVNDGSTDSSEKIINAYTDPRIRYFKQGNNGVSAARNVGLDHMIGKFFCFLDADDKLTLNSITDRLEVFNNNPDLEFVEGKVKVFDTNTGIITREYTPDFRGNPFNKLIELSGKCFFGITWMIKRLSGKTYRFRSGLSHSEDLLFYLSISETGKYLSTDSCIYECRVGRLSAMSDLIKLENGYFEVYNVLKGWNNVSKKQLSTYHKKAKLIVFKSYLGALNFYRALRVLGR